VSDYDVIVHYAGDGGSETEHATEATLMGCIHKCLSYPSVERFEVIKRDYPAERSES
jgi:hypothetical protein